MDQLLLSDLQTYVVNPLKHEAHTKMFRNTVPTSKKTWVSTTDIHQLTLLKEITAGYAQTHTKPTNTLWGQNAVLKFKAGGAYS
jgi:hypothetical protein